MVLVSRPSPSISISIVPVNSCRFTERCPSGYLPTPLAEVLRRNAYGGRPPVDAEQLTRLEAHVRQEAGRLAETARNDLLK